MGSGKASALGRNKAGPVDAAAAISTFMGGAATKRQLSALLGGLGGGKAGGGAAAGGAGTATKGQSTAKGAKETGVAAAAGSGASSGLPTTSDDGTITMNFRQVNQDGAGPMTAAIDATSGGTDPAAFQDAQVTTDVPGIGIGGLSGAAVKDFPLKVQMPAGMTCTGSAGGAQNVCVVRVQNSAIAGPFGGSGAFTQSAAARKRSIEVCSPPLLDTDSYMLTIDHSTLSASATWPAVPLPRRRRHRELVDQWYTTHDRYEDFLIIEYIALSRV
jgi:hypothetical protein